MGDFPSAKSINAQKHRKSSQYQKHYKLKSANSAKAAASEKQNSKVSASKVSKLPSNWSKYEEDIEETNDAAYAVGIDLSTLALLPTNNSHFQLRQDKVFLPRNDSDLKPGEIFEIDMNFIHLSLATIPFYKRMNIDESLLSMDEQQYMVRKAIDANGLYQEYLTKRRSVPCLLSSTPPAQRTATSGDDLSYEEVEIRTDDLDLVVTELSATAATEGEARELEEWLSNLI